MSKKIITDERTSFIENNSLSIGFKIYTFALLIDIVFRAIIYKEAAWDIMFIVLLSTLVATIYQYRNKLFSN